MNLDVQVVREAVQAKLLMELMGNAVHKELVLKGGLAMRAVHGSVRMTKDIDLDADGAFPRSTVHAIVTKSIRNALRAGLIENAQVSEPKQTETTMRWKIWGQVAGTQSPINLTIEISRRQRLVEGHIIEVDLPDSFVAHAGATRNAQTESMNKSAPGHAASPKPEIAPNAPKVPKIRVMDSQAIAMTKVLALTDPRRTAPRDLYDLFVLIEAQVEPPIALLAGVPKPRLEEAVNELWGKIESMSYEMFSTEVLSVMPDVFAKAFGPQEFDGLRLTVATQVQKWLDEAIQTQASGLASRVMGDVLKATPHPPGQAASKSGHQPAKTHP